jgi:tetratricopeptide (TPR) repeat protein
MAEDEHPDEQQGQESQGPGRRKPLTEAQRKRIQKCFDHATKQMEQGGHDYAADYFTQCLVADPGNLDYAKGFVENLQKKYKNNKKGHPLAFFQTRGPRGAIKKALGQAAWDDVIKNGAAVLKVNPWDVPALTAIATATAAITAEMGAPLGDTELFYLKSAYEANPKDADVCRLVAIALGKRVRYDEAIAFWHKVEQLRPTDEEAPRSISVLMAEKTIKRTTQAKIDAGLIKPTTTAAKPGQEELTQEDQLKRAIRREPGNLTNYYDLSQLYINSDQHKEAEEVLVKALKVSNNDPDVWERLEDARLRALRQQMVAAQARAKQAQDENAKAKAKTEAKGLLKLIVQKELGIWKGRCERYPTNLMFKFEVGLRYQMLGDYNEAIKEYQGARNDPRKKGVCLLNLGECFRHIKQYRLAMQHYELSIQEIPDRDVEHKKLALYRAGRLAYDLKDWEVAEKNLGTLAALDYSYKDVSALLDEINKLRNN